MQLRRAQLVLMLAALLPTIAMTSIGIVLLAMGQSTTTLISGVLVLTFCTSGITGYILGSIFVGRGASLVRVQSDFVSSVSHELRTPLTSIRLLLDSLNDGRLEDVDRTKVISLLGRETDRLDKLVARVIELSRLQSNYQFLRERVDVESLVEESIAAFDAATLSQPTKINRQLDPGLVVLGDRATLVRAIVNLLTNAWKYTGEDKQITIVAHASARWVEIGVRDNGIGIDPAELRAIFEQFTRGRAAHESGAPGSGLGLAFVRAIVRGHGGKVDLTSKHGQTQVTIKLKAARPSVVLDPAPRST
jgi:two-component system phosphate regulon sensor histidine kinase PhoR